jgi:hypothetical protein
MFQLAKEYLEVQREIQIQSQRMESLVKRLHEVEQCPDPDEEEEERKLEQEKVTRQSFLSSITCRGGVALAW